MSDFKAAAKRPSDKHSFTRQSRSILIKNAFSNAVRISWILFNVQTSSECANNITKVRNTLVVHFHGLMIFVSVSYLNSDKYFVQAQTSEVTAQ